MNLSMEVGKSGGISQHGASSPSSIVRAPYAGFRDVPTFSNPNNNGGSRSTDDGMKYYRLLKRIAGSADMYT